MSFDPNRVKPIIRESLLAYINHGRPVGHFLTAVLSNDLSEAFARADDENVRTLGDLVAWLYNNAPSQCWGSPVKVDAWMGRAPSWVERGEREITWERGV